MMQTVAAIFTVMVLAFLCTCGPAVEPPAPPERFRMRTETGVTSENRLTPEESFNIVTYLYYYNGGGVAATDISGDGLPDLYFTNNQSPNKYYINEGNWRFRDATESAGVAGAGNWSTGVSVTDINGDGLPDIYVCNVDGLDPLHGRNELFVQQADGTFRDEAAAYGLDFGGFNTQAYWFDYDGDGDQDMYLLRHSVHSDATYRDGEGRNVRDSLAGDLLLRNDGGSFRDVTGPAGLYSSRIGYGLSAAVADYDGDGRTDIYVCNDFSENDYLYLNRGDGTFREVVRERMGHTSNFSMGSDVGDLDGDGRPDLVTLDMRPGREAVLKSTASAESFNLYRLKRRAGYHDQLPRNNVQWNRGDGVFSEIGELSGLAATDWSWSVLVEDFDLDGVPEVFVANGIDRRPNDLDYLKFVGSSLARASSDLVVAGEMPAGAVANRYFVRDSNLTFRPVEAGLGLVGSTTGAAVADLDGDGDPDLVLNNVNAPATLYENLTLDGGRLVGTSPDSSTVSYRFTDGSQRELSRMTMSPFARAAQRGFLSQSAPASLVGESVPTRPPADTVAYTVVSRSEESDGTVTEVDRSASFDREPLQPFFGAVPADDPAYTLSAETGDLRVEAGPWLPLRIGRRVGQEWTYTEVAGTRGLWQSIDLAGPPGAEEIIAGNWGLNSGLGQPTAAAPLRLYLPDLDGNGKRDPLFTYVREGREYTLADKDELAAQLPSWRRNNLSYADFSQRDFRENFPDLEAEPLLAETLAHLRLRRDPAGQWRAEELPLPTQITPVRSVSHLAGGVLLGGNALDVLPRVGRQDAAALQLLRPDNRVQLLDLGEGWNHREVVLILGAGPDRRRVYFADGGWLVLRLH
ncbi:FG-GAP repeat domain-containing protein [Lewinella sp. IMCC34183]|uniref:FG-GAP repeat domain-containing protein n=1 Tax=Lewinella sp. IMCC34183 TaxID=2248762 RepID=UPI000E270488|nr:VCBS repeat-containing protein [Lewinella sp. IMCC34183]